MLRAPVAWDLPPSLSSWFFAAGRVGRAQQKRQQPVFAKWRLRDGWAVAPLVPLRGGCRAPEPHLGRMAATKQVPPALRGTRLLLVGDSHMRNVMWDMCTLLLDDNVTARLDRQSVNMPGGRDMAVAWMEKAGLWAEHSRGRVVCRSLHRELGRGSAACVLGGALSVLWLPIYAAGDIPGDFGLAAYKSGQWIQFNDADERALTGPPDGLDARWRSWIVAGAPPRASAATR